MKLSTQDKMMIALLLRSPQDSNGWVSCGLAIFNHFQVANKDIFECDEKTNKVRLTHDGKVVAKYL